MNEDPLDPKLEKIMPESVYHPSKAEIDFVGEVYQDFFRWRTYRSGAFRQFQNHSLEDVLRISRELFWNAVTTESEDLAALGLQFNIPFTRKEVMENVGRISSLGIKPRIHGDALDSYGVKVLNGIYQRWRFKNNDKVEKFWQWLYGVVNGTVCLYVGYNDQQKVQKFLKSYNPKDGTYQTDEKKVPYWNDVEVKTIPLEDIYLSKVWERDIQKQGKLIWRTQMEPADFHREFQNYPDHVYVTPGNRIAEDSLYYRLLGGTGVTTLNKIEVMRVYDTDNDHFGIVANGILLNKLGASEDTVVAPLPFNHKMMPFVWAIEEAVDEKLAYGIPLPFKVRDLHKMEGTQYVLLLEHMLRVVDPPYLSSDIESPDLIFGAKKVIPVTDTGAYKPIEVTPVGNEYMTTMNSVQQLMTTIAQGGVNQAIPSIQPKSAAEVDQVNQAKQQALGIPILMYYNMVRQECLLMLKTALQFYTTDKYSKEGANITKALMVPNMPLTEGGVGDIEIRFVKKITDPMTLKFEAIRKAAQSGKMTEIIEAPIELITNLEFEIIDIELEPDQTSEMKKAQFVQSVIAPMLQTYVPMGLADPAKVMLRHLEALDEHPADYASNQALPQIYSAWGTQYPVQKMIPQAQQQQPSGNPQPGGMAGPQASGMLNGGQSRGGQGASPMTNPNLNKPMQQAQAQ